MKSKLFCRTKIMSLAVMIISCSWRVAAEERVDKFMGDWQGISKTDGKEAPVVAQVIAWGDGKYEAHILGAFDVRAKPLAVLSGTVVGNKLSFGDAAFIEDGKFTGKIQGVGACEMKHVERSSPTLGAKPPEGAVVLLDGKNLDQWQHMNGKTCAWKLFEDGVMEVVPGKGSVISKKTFTDHKIHLEFRLPFMPQVRGQGRGNSGVYVQGRYEVQVIDSYGLEGKDDECGGIYKVGAPKANMCYPPLRWQTYDITFKAPRFDSEGRKTADAMITVLHNGVEIHKDLAVPHPTVASEGGDPKVPGGLYLQDHGSQVQYRNVWIVETKE